MPAPFFRRPASGGLRDVRVDGISRANQLHADDRSVVRRPSPYRYMQLVRQVGRQAIGNERPETTPHIYLSNETAYLAPASYGLLPSAFCLLTADLQTAASNTIPGRTT